jgi:hypothetical protein
MRIVLALVLAAAALPAGSVKYVDVLATYVAPTKAGRSAAVSVTLYPTEPDIHVNENPGPRLELDPEQQVLVYEPPKTDKAPVFDPAAAHYLDPKVPVRFDVTLAKGVAKGTHEAKAKVVYFYCSSSKGWCRKGTENIELTVPVE